MPILPLYYTQLVAVHSTEYKNGSSPDKILLYLFLSYSVIYSLTKLNSLIMFLLTNFMARHAEVQLLLCNVKWHLVLHTRPLFLLLLHKEKMNYRLPKSSLKGQQFMPYHCHTKEQCPVRSRKAARWHNWASKLFIFLFLRNGILPN